MDGNIIWQPQTLAETEFLKSEEDWASYYCEDAVGDRQREILLMDCLHPEKLNDPHWVGVIVVGEGVEQNVVNLYNYWLHNLPHLESRFDERCKMFIFPSRARIYIAETKNLDDAEKRLCGWEITDLKFDNLNKFDRNTFLYSRLQNRTYSKIKPTIRFTIAGEGWATDEFVKPHKPFGIIQLKETFRDVDYFTSFRSVIETIKFNDTEQRIR